MMNSAGDKGRLLRLFVYGTLKVGQRYHERYCQGVIDVQPATIWGRLYDLPVGYPMLVLPERSALAIGTQDFEADVALQGEWPAVPPQSTLHEDGGDWELIRGEILSFDDAAARLPAIDALEDFNPGRPSFYHRVLAWCEVPAITVWVYCAADRRLPPGAVRIGRCWAPTDSL